MEGCVKIDLEESCASLALDLGSKPSEIISYTTDVVNNHKGQDGVHSSRYSSSKALHVYKGEPASLRTFAEKNEQPSIPFTISLSSDLVESNEAVGSTRTASLRLLPAEASMTEKMLSHDLCAALGDCSEPEAGMGAFSMAEAGMGAFSMDGLPPKEISCLQDPRSFQQVSSAVARRGELPLHMSLASDGGSVLQLATTALAPPVSNATSETEQEPLASDEGIVPKKDKVKKRPRKLLQDAPMHDLSKSSEKQPVIRWKDVWVAQLIHIRGRMHSTFTSPQRQRVDLWQIVKHEMTNSCHGFDKDSEACRKKWIRVYKEYKDDRHLSNDEKTQKCRFYDLVDFYMGDRANCFGNLPICPELPLVRPDAIHAVEDLMIAPLPPSNEVDIKAADCLVVAPQVSSDTSLSKPTANSLSKNSPPSKKSRVVERPQLEKRVLFPSQVAPVLTVATSKRPQIKSSVQTMLSELVHIGKEMLQTTKDFEKEKLAVLHSIKDTLGKIAKKI